MKKQETIADLIGLSLGALRARLPDRVVLDALFALTTDRASTLRRHGELEHYLGKTFIGMLFTPNLVNAEQQVAHINDPDTYELLVHTAICWWLARDALWPYADHQATLTRVEGETDPHDLHALTWMCYVEAGAPGNNWLQWRHKPVLPEDRGSRPGA